MMKQITLATVKGFEVHGRAMREAVCLARRERLVPGADMCGLIEPHDPKAGNGRPPGGLERMLRMHRIANWFNLAGEAGEGALYDAAAFREFCRIDLGRERVPDSTTLLNFRHLLERHEPGAAVFAKVGQLLLANGMKVHIGVDSAYPGENQRQRLKNLAHKARDFTNKRAYKNRPLSDAD